MTVSENQSPRPQDRVFFTFDYFSNVNGALNLKLGAPVSDILVNRYVFGFEKTFDNGNASIGVRVPLDQLTANTRVPARYKQIGGTSTALDDMNIFSTYIRQLPDLLLGSSFALRTATVAPTINKTTALALSVGSDSQENDFRPLMYPTYPAMTSCIRPSRSLLNAP